jgi:hypothetical protein
VHAKRDPRRRHGSAGIERQKSGSTEWTAIDPLSFPLEQRTYFSQLIAGGVRAFDVSRRLAGASAQLLPSSVVLTQDAIFNAKARSFGVGIHVAVPTILHFIFNELLRWPNLFETIGDPSRESRHGQYAFGIPVSLPSTMSIVEAVKVLPSYSRPTDERRAFAAFAMADLVSSFCVCHEVCHVVFGHAAAYERQFGQLDFLEFFSSQLTQVPAYRLGRTWEYEADINGGYMVTSSILGDENRGHFSEAFQIDGSPGTYERGVLYVWFFALHILFLFLGQRAPRPSSLSRHPAPAVRSAYIFGEITPQLALEERSHLTRRQLERLRVDACRNAERAWKQMGMRTRTTSAPWVEDQVKRLRRDTFSLRQTYWQHSWFKGLDPLATTVPFKT